MSPLRQVVGEMMRAGGNRLRVAAMLAVLVVLTGLLLMGVSGWFVAASAVAGLAGYGLVFDFFRPSAVIRVTTMARAASRYGERLLGHDITLRLLNGLRLRVFAALSTKDVATLLQLRSAEGLNRLTADLDAVEGVLIRLLFPAVACVLALLLGVVVVALLTGWGAALGLLLVLGAGLLFLLHTGRGLRAVAGAQEAAMQALRARSAESSRLRVDAVMRGASAASAAHVLDASVQLEAARALLDRADRRAGPVLTLAPALAAAAVLGLGHAAGPARVLAALLVALALGEPLRALWRGLAELGRMQLGAERLAGLQSSVQEGLSGNHRDQGEEKAQRAPQVAGGSQEHASSGMRQPDTQAPLLQLQSLCVVRPDGQGPPLFAPVTTQLDRAQWLLLQAPSGAGKSTLLYALAGLLPASGGRILLRGRELSEYSESELRAKVVLVPQRPALLAGTIAQNLALAAPLASTEQMQAVLRMLGLWHVLVPRGGLDCELGAHGAGLSGGELRRLALARALLCAPVLLLLDEPTEGLDLATAAEVLAGIRQVLPEAAVMLASHRAEDLDARVRQFRLRPMDAPEPAP